jgi:hypothetical protein
MIRRRTLEKPVFSNQGNFRDSYQYIEEFPGILLSVPIFLNPVSKESHLDYGFDFA